jgi:hypothetical protein
MMALLFFYTGLATNFTPSGGIPRFKGVGIIRGLLGRPVTPLIYAHL